jgi:hypothetical protein
LPVVPSVFHSPAIVSSACTPKFLSPEHIPGTGTFNKFELHLKNRFSIVFIKIEKVLFEVRNQFILKWFTLDQAKCIGSRLPIFPE